MNALICSMYINNKMQAYVDALTSHPGGEGISSIKNQLNDETNKNKLNENV